MTHHVTKSGGQHITSHRSVSQLSTFVRCGESYRLERVERRPAKPAAWFAQGLAFHKASEDWELSEREMSPFEITTTFLAEYENQIAAGLAIEPDRNKWLTGGRVKGSDDIERRRDRGLEQLRTYIAYAQQAPERPLYVDPVTPAVEYEFKLDLDGVEVIGFIDLVMEWPGGIIGPRDLKTGSKRPSWEFQLGVYKVALEQDFGIEVQWGDYYMAKDGKPLPPMDLSRFTREYVTDLFHKLDKAVNSGVFIPNPGDTCRVCGVAEFCTAIGGNQ